MLDFQKLDVSQRAIEFLLVANRIRARRPKGNATWPSGVDLLERIVAMLRKLIDS